MLLRYNYVLITCAAWTLLVAAAAGVAIKASYESMLEQARVAARVAFEKDLTYRRWNALRGGVYVRVNEQNQPNPFLQVPDRDLHTVEGVTLTMINPAYMTRQAYEIQQSSAEVQNHITSLNPIRPQNQADPWEHQALISFHSGIPEVFSHETVNGQPYLRIMRPVLIEKDCLRCHAVQGYRLGEIRGGISVSVPLNTHLNEFHALTAKTAASYSLIWAIGLAGLVVGGRKLRHSVVQERHARLAAEAASVAKSEFLANMSHEIRTPLNGVLGMLQLLREENTPEEQASFVDMAYDSGRRLLALLNDILDFSSIEAGELKLTSEPFCTRDLLASAANVFTAACAENGLRLELAPDASLPETLMGDEARLRQVLFNLLGNAIKFTPNGSVKVEAWAKPHGTDYGRVRFYLAITDTGIGMADDKLTHMFERFTQADGSFSRRYQGAGLGLAIVKRLVELMHGTISVSSEPDHGTSFYLMLPLALPAPIPAATACDKAAASGELPPRRMLLVEDEEVSRLATKLLLERLGYEISCAADGREAVEACRETRFDAVLMDIQMPEMDGVEATRIIRAMESQRDLPRVPIIALTAYAMPGDRERFLEAGLDEHVAKPVQMEDLKHVLLHAMGRSRERLDAAGAADQEDKSA